MLQTAGRQDSTQEPALQGVTCPAAFRGDQWSSALPQIYPSHTGLGPVQDSCHSCEPQKLCPDGGRVPSLRTACMLRQQQQLPWAVEFLSGSLLGWRRQMLGKREILSWKTAFQVALFSCPGCSIEPFFPKDMGEEQGFRRGEAGVGEKAERCSLIYTNSRLGRLYLSLLTPLIVLELGHSPRMCRGLRKLVSTSLPCLPCIIIESQSGLCWKGC